MPSHHTPVWHGKGCNHFNSEHYTNRRYSFGIAGDKFSSLNIRKGVFQKNSILTLLFVTALMPLSTPSQPFKDAIVDKVERSITFYAWIF